MLLAVLVTNLDTREVIARFEIEAPSIPALLESGEIRRRVGDRVYDSLVIRTIEMAKAPAGLWGQRALRPR
jgi:hypothetical protein